jgi:hypothetical protein
MEVENGILENFTQSATSQPLYGRANLRNPLTWRPAGSHLRAHPEWLHLNLWVPVITSIPFTYSMNMGKEEGKGG